VPLGVSGLPVTGSGAGAAIAIAILSAINYVGVIAGARFQNAITLVKIATLVALVAFGLSAPATSEPQWTVAPPGLSWSHAIGVAMIGVLWCYDGFYQATFCAGEIREPAKSLPRGMIVGTVLTLALYLLVNLVYLRALPIAEMGSVNSVAEASAVALFGPHWAQAMRLGILVSVFGCLSACVLTGARIYLAMARDGLFFRSLATVHPAYRTPTACIIAQAVWAMLLAVTGSYEQLGTYTIFAVFLFHAAAGIALIVLRRTRPAHARPYRTWGYPWTPIFFIVMSLCFVVNTLVVRPTESLIGLALIALGLPAYAWWRRTSAKPDPRLS